jgi:NADPH:quinone reductase-like Zn-dependent oxidoreductase
VEGRLEAGQSVVLPGSGGLSVYMLQLAAALGITAIVTSSSDEKLARMRALGAAQGINYCKVPEWSSAVRAATAGLGADMVLDIGGQATIDQSVAACRMAGRIIIVGSTGNAAPELPLREVVMRHIRIVGMAVGSVAHLRDLVAFIDTAGLRPIIDRRYDLEQLGEAFRYQLSGQHFGKIAITLA